MGCVLYCIGKCKQILVGFRPISDAIDGVDEGQASGVFICKDCEKENLVNSKHPFAKFAITETEIEKDPAYVWQKSPLSSVLPDDKKDTKSSD